MSHQFFSAKKLLRIIEEQKYTRISDVVLLAEKELTGHSEEEIFENMRNRLRIMRQSIEEGKNNTKKSQSKMTDHNAKKILNVKGKPLFMSEMMRKGVKYALAIMENNACMGKIVAVPTAGSAGIVPGCIWTVAEEWKLDEDAAVRGLLASAGIGIIIASISTFSGAKAGCQAEVGSSTAMAAAGISEMRGLSPEMCINASSLALKNMLGLACDPVAGLVEVPCVKRNAFGVTHAMTASDLSFAGVKSVIPFDEVLEAMNNIAQNMSENIRETSKGGLAMSKTAKEIVRKILE